ncbi:MAG: MFS transporter [Chloroflexi bacterium]|nr:MFS transporter [Chloroflexota bacterium]
MNDSDVIGPLAAPVACTTVSSSPFTALAHRIARGRLYYGWVLVVLACVTSAVSFGTRSAFAVFFVALITEFGWSRGEVSAILTISSLSWAAGAPVVGSLLDRYGPRVVFPVAGLLMGLGLVLTSTRSELWELYLCWGILTAFPFNAMQASHQSVTLAAWFPHRRGFVGGLSAAGGGFGVLLIVPLTQYLISTFGWRQALVGLGALIVAIVVIPNALFQYRRPSDLGLKVEAPRQVSRALAPDQKGPTLGEALRHWRFYLLGFGLFAGAYPLHTLLVHQVVALVDAGLSRQDAANVFALGGFLASVLTIATGWTSDRVGRERTYIVGAFCLASAAAMLILIGNLGASPLLVVLFVALFAPGFASRQGLHPVIMGDVVRGPSFGALVGILSGTLAVGTGVGPFVAGYLFDITGSYQAPLTLAIVSTLVGLAAISIVGPRRGWR